MDTAKTLVLVKGVTKQLNKEIEVDPTFELAIANYCTHQGVDSLQEDELEEVIGAIAAKAVSDAQERGDQVVHGGDFMSALIYGFGCSEGMGNCHNAASEILGRPIVDELSVPEEIRHLPSIERSTKEVDISFLNAVDNYRKHLGIRDLKEQELMTVLDSLASEAIQGGGTVVGGRAFTDALVSHFGCEKGMGECQKAAGRILGKVISVDLDLQVDDDNFKAEE